MASVDEVIGAIRVLHAAQGRLVVGIDGFGGAGKSTLAESVAEHVGGVVVALDDFIVKERVDDDSWEAVWDRARVIRQVLEPFRSGDEVMFPRFEWERDRLSSPIRLRATEVLILEGITALHSDLRPFVDYAIWADAPLEVATARGRARDAGNENEARWDAWAANDLAYLAECRPHSWVDAVVATAE